MKSSLMMTALLEQQEKLVAEREQQLAEVEAGMQKKVAQTEELEQRCTALAGQVEELESMQKKAEEQQQETICRLESSVAELQAALTAKVRQLLMW